LRNLQILITILALLSKRHNDTSALDRNRFQKSSGTYAPFPCLNGWMDVDQISATIEGAEEKNTQIHSLTWGSTRQRSFDIAIHGLPFNYEPW